jgi:myxalamid-type polyketide synthase MxaE and MxaD
LSPEKRALLEQRLRGPVAPPALPGAEPLAVIGIGCRFPGDVRDPESLWQLIAQGTDAISEVPPDRWSLDDLYDADASAPGKTSTRWGGWLRDVDAFDASLFGIAPREAEQMDPQQRLLLETAWDALEHAGQAPDSLKGTQAGVFVGVHSHSIDYCLMQYADTRRLDAFSSTGTAHNFLSGRLSYLLDLHGPSLVVDTACSSSLVAVHLACQSIRSGESTMAIAAGVNLMLTPAFTVAASRMHMMSPDGRCKSFDGSANGFVRSEGCGVVVIKRLPQALADGDRVLAVIRGSAVNQDGHTNGITAPNGLSQQLVIRDALRNAGVDPGQVGYLEAHGTGTPLGDPIEVEALTAVLGRPRPSGSTVALGSLKSNIGHLEGAAGVAGLIKAVLCLHHREIPPVVHFKHLNPHLSLAGTAVVVPTALTPWECRDGRRIAGVSSFGWSGTNTHVVLEEAPDLRHDEASIQDGRLRLLPFSARTPEALAAQAVAWQRWCALPAHAEAAAVDVCDAAARRRAHHECRAAVVGRAAGEYGELIAAMVRGESHPRLTVGRVGERAGVVFVFPGQGSQWVGMGRQLLVSEPVFREAIEQCGTALSAYVDWSLVDELRASADASRLRDIDVVQPTLFSVEVALAALWRSWGITPDAVVGHSMGEVAAAYVAGALTLDDAARVICLRSQLLRRISGKGAMAVVELSLDEASRAIVGYETQLSIAVSNSPGSTVISGDVAAIEEVMATLLARDVFCRAIKVDVASHSPQVDVLRDDLLMALAPVRPRAATIPIYSTVTADVANGAEFDAAYWARNLRQPVLLSATVARLAGDGNTTFIEMSPHPILLPAIDTGLAALGHSGIVRPSLRRDEDEREVLLGSAAGLYVAGYDLDWRAINGAGAFIELPQYQYQRERFWLAAPVDLPSAAIARQGHAVLGPSRERTGGGHVWDVASRGVGLPPHEACAFDGIPMVAPALWCESALEAARVAGASAVSTLELVRAFVPPATGEPLAGRAEAVVSAGGDFMFRLQSRAGGRPWTTHVTATLTRSAGVPCALDRVDALAQTHERLTGHQAYERLAAGGWQVGVTLRALTEVHLGRRDLVARYDTSSAGHHPSHRLPLAVWQSCLDAAALLAGAAAEAAPDEIHMPVRVGEIVLGGAPATSGWVVARRAASGAGTVDVAMTDDLGATAVTLRDVELIRHGASARDVVTAGVDDWLFDLAWDSVGTPAPARPHAEPVSWLLLADRDGVGVALSAVLADRGDVVTLAKRDDGGDVGPAVRKFLESAGGRRCEVVHLWSLDLPGIESVAQDALEGALLRSSASILHTVRAMAAPVEGVSSRLWLVTRGAQPAALPIGAEGPAQATVWGLGRVIAEEHLEHWGGLIDIDPSAPAVVSARALADQILSHDDERQVAFRDGVRYGARVTTARRPVGSSPWMRFRPDASYLVTGGFTGVGAATARWMVQEGARRIVLIGRTPLPSRDRWLSLDPHTDVGGRVAVVLGLEALGAHVRVEILDVSDEAALGAFWHGYHAEGWPAVRGIIHAAVVIEDGLLRDLDARTFAVVMRPKVSGAWLLHRLSRNADLDFFVMFSSLGAVLGQTGQGNYSAANAFLDALAHYRLGLGLPATSINWAGWREAGLGAASAGARRTIQNLDAEGIASYTTAQGLDVLGRVLADAPAQAVVMPMSRSRFRHSHWATSDPKLFSKILGAVRETTSAVSTPRAQFRVRLLEADPSERRGIFEQFLAEQLAQVLRLPVSRVDPSRPMGSLGLESLMALEFRNRLEAQLDLKLSATIVWNHPTVVALARHLAGRMDVGFGDAPSAAAPSHDAELRVQDPSPGLDELSDLEALQALAGSSGESSR